MFTREETPWIEIRTVFNCSVYERTICSGCNHVNGKYIHGTKKNNSWIIENLSNSTPRSFWSVILSLHVGGFMNLSESKDNSRTELWFSLWIFLYSLQQLSSAFMCSFPVGGEWINWHGWLWATIERMNHCILLFNFIFPISYTWGKKMKMLQVVNKEFHVTSSQV